ncbi:hypothetical protein [Euzebya sp.]|uniref:hypothetical protein n=1 Tax=Euzebya sp. TaxID=1971409 RepID=UPI00351312F3
MLRRLAAVGAVGLYPLSLLVLDDGLRLRPPFDSVPVAVLVVLAVALWIATFVFVNEFRRRLAQAPDDQLDERERAVRDEAHLISYRILGGALVLLALWTLVGAPLVAGSREISLDVVLDAAFALVIAVFTLPSAVVAWRDTGDDLDEDDEVEGVAPPVDGDRVRGSA